jgi:methionyl aminopeptidase
MKPKTKNEIENIRKSGKILSAVLRSIEQNLKPGITGVEIDNLARRELKNLGGEPAFLGVPAGPGVPDFPASVCISVNDAVVHGIPNDIPFKSGDVVGFDFGVIYKGMITDAARTFIIGGTAKNKQIQNLVNKTRLSLDAGIKQIKPGATTGDIGSAVQRVLEEDNLGIVRELVGHGVGHELHEAPEIPNYGFAGTGAILKEGMTIAVEPMATLGEWRVVIDTSDGWTVRTRDGSLSAHFEDTLLVTNNGVEILTR